MKTIQIQGKEYKVSFNFGVAIEYEKLSGKPFQIGEDFNAVEKQMQIAYAAMKRNNKDVPEFDELVDTMTLEENLHLQEAIAEEIMLFYKVPGTLQQQSSEEVEESKKD